MIRKDQHNKREESHDNGLPVEWKENPFSVPDGYFEDLPARIMARVREESHGKVRMMHWSPFRKALAIAVGILLLASVSTILVWTSRVKEYPGAIADTLTSEEIQSVLATNGIDEYTLVSLVIEQETLESLADFSGVNDSSLMPEDLQEYLLQSNNIESLIINSK